MGRVGKQGSTPKSGMPYAEQGKLLSDLLLSLSGQEMDNIRETNVVKAGTAVQSTRRARCISVAFELQHIAAAYAPTPSFSVLVPSQFSSLH